MKFLVTTATLAEIKPLLNFFKPTEIQVNKLWSYTDKKMTIDFLITGVGAVFTAFNLTRHLENNPGYDIVLNTGLCGANKKSRLEIGEVVNITQEEFADLGINDNGEFIKLTETQFLNRNSFPFENGLLKNPNTLEFSAIVDYDNIRSITTCTTSGEQKQIQQRLKNFDFDVENMEGAAFFYVLLHYKIKFFEIRAVSNYIEPRNTKNWDIELALKRLTIAVKSFLLDIYYTTD